MLKDLKILNGEMHLPFNSLNTIYTINVKEDVTSLKLDYQIEDNYNISVFGNDLANNPSEVVLTVYNDQDMMSYYLYVYKENALEATTNIQDTSSLEIGNKDLPNFTIPVIASVCFIIILLFFTLLFKKKKN